MRQILREALEIGDEKANSLSSRRELPSQGNRKTIKNDPTAVNMSIKGKALQLLK